MASVFTPAQQAAFEADGYVLIRGLFDSEEISLMRSSIEQDPDLQNSLYNRKDAQGKATMMATWNHPGDSAYGLAARTERVVDTMEQMLGGEVYHYHSKLTAKEPLDGGAWEWHQDYGYWYHNGCLLPHMASVMVALDKANKENGCLQVLRGSHIAGRVDHGIIPGEQVEASLVVDLEVRYADRILGLRVSGDARKEGAQRARDDATLAEGIHAACQRERFATARLAVREDRAIVALEDGSDDGLGDALEDLLLRRASLEHTVKAELPLVPLVVHV